MFIFCVGFIGCVDIMVGLSVWFLKFSIEFYKLRGYNGIKLNNVNI